jgi:SAM-dependent methyltransferase
MLADLVVVPLKILSRLLRLLCKTLTFRSRESRRREILAIMGYVSRFVLEPADIDPARDMLLDEVRQLQAPRILEIGGRRVVSSIREDFGDAAEYVGLDIHPGENVDVVGDAHRLSEYFAPGHFDVVVSSAVFEHLAMPWKVILEANKVLRTGGVFYVLTHFMFPGHERPWDFWRYSEEAFRVLLDAKTWFEFLDAREHMPAAIFPFVRDRNPKGLGFKRTHPIVSALARKTGQPASHLNWDVRVEDILTTEYPLAKAT